MAALIFLTLLCFLVILISGYRLHKNGKPYGTLLQTIHKLIALGLVVYLIIVLRLMRPFSPLALAAMILAAVLFVLLFASGGWISAAKEAPGAVKVVHKVLPYLVILATGASLFLLVFNKG
jgi:hypothetical protein